MAPSNGRASSPVSLVGSDADVVFYRRQLAQLGQPILLLGCANGRLACELGAAVPEVLGVDPSAVMISLAENARGRRPDECRARVRFLSADLRSLRLSEKFGAVLAPHNALALMPSVLDLEAMIATARHHLRPGGLLLLEASNPRPSGESTVEDAGAHRLRLAGHRAAFAAHLREGRRSHGVSADGIHRLRLRQYFPWELDAALRGAGFEPTARYGYYDEKPFDPQDALQLVVAFLRER